MLNPIRFFSGVFTASITSATALALPLATALATTMLCAPQLAIAHEIAGKATLLVYVKQQDTRLIVLVRAPMETMTEVQFPVRGPGFIDLANANTVIADAAQIYLTQSLHFFADGAELSKGTLIKTRVALPADKSFVDYDTALATINSPPLASSEDLYWKQASLDALIEFPVTHANAKFSVEPDLHRIAMETRTVLHFLPTDGTERIFNYVGNPGRVELEPSWWYATYQFIQMGFFHILDGIDHVLFLLCLVIPARSVRALIPAITAFTVAHSITLISSAFGVVPTALWFAPLIEALIAFSVFYMACENVLGLQMQKRWLIVFGFGLIHGFGFSFILADRMQFAGGHLVSALLAFNVGVEFGQLLVLIIAAPLLIWFFNRLKHVTHDVPGDKSDTGPSTAWSGERIGTILLSTLVAHTAWHWCTERGAALFQFSWTAPTFDASFFIAAMRWAMLLLGSFAAMWLLNEMFRHFSQRSTQ